VPPTNWTRSAELLIKNGQVPPPAYIACDAAAALIVSVPLPPTRIVAGRVEMLAAVALPMSVLSAAVPVEGGSRSGRRPRSNDRRPRW